jgi:Asp-tRNA(Asn)/Glu-tRNA(Gln) amidotransferase A subunit family amidase
MNPPSNVAAWQIAIEKLRAAGMMVEQTDMPGLTSINGRELTMNQVIDLASQL